MAEFKITRFRYTWKGQWSGSSVTYYKDDVVTYQGSAWVCVRQHISDVFNNAQIFTNPGDTNPSPGWTKMSDGREFLGDWSNGVRYDPGVIVLSGGNLYLCVASHQSATNFNTNLNNWEILAVGSNFRNSWTIDTRYRVGDVIRYNGYTYQCVLEHTSSSSTDGVQVGNNDDDDDSTAETWTTLVENYTYVGEYNVNHIYRLNDLVKYGGSIFKCISQHTSSNIEGNIDSARFVTYLSGFRFSEQWYSNEYYAIGDVVKYGGLLYQAVLNNLNSVPGVTTTFEEGNPTWNTIFKGINYAGIYDPQSNYQYKNGDVVRRGGSLWLSVTDQNTDDSSLRPIDTSNWELLITAQNFTGSWAVDKDYNLYDAVYWRGTVYYANTPHFSSYENFPGDNGSGYEFWTTLLVGDVNAGLTSYGDLLTYNLTRNIIRDGSTQFVLGDTSSIGPTNVPIGDPDEVLEVQDNQGTLGYSTWGTLQRTFFVRKNGINDTTDPNRGRNYFKPWLTVKYALEQANDGFEGYTTIKVSTGEYEEILPLIVPARTAVVGEELRSVTIRANRPNAALVNDPEYMLETLLRLGSILPQLVQGISVTPSLTNLIPQIQVPAVDATTAFIVDGTWATIYDTINFKINEEGSAVTVAGSNDATTDMMLLDAIQIIESNKNFLINEALSFVALQYPEYILDTDFWTAHIEKFIAALQHDLLYSGNYQSVLEGRYYANAVLGSQLEDMFYVRDTTGIRNMTLKGLEGTKPAAQPGEPYQIPTGGAFVSLDPGWGPLDNRTWVTNRSCYVQNVTTFGTGAVGQKIDGALHNGGNRSIVSNDFTQVISDGIGAWVLNGGRAELVSVFTYYAHIGMFAQNGGIIRATNGNSSYGDFGALADGIDTDEEAQIGSLNTRTEQATVASAFAGEVNDFILALEFSNCGQNYTTADYTITSSGTGAVAVQEEIRDKAVFEVQVLSLGAEFSQYGNQAQAGNETTITLATSEAVEESEILGMRVIIISGEGTGQYGYVDAYNSFTKILNVKRESDDQPGWDNLIPGTPARALLTTGTRYRIEPRPIFSAPPYDAVLNDIDVAGEWASAAYGETTETFTGISGTPGTGSTVDITPIPAVFTVIKLGRTYQIIMTSSGAGYASGDIIVIDGGDLSGISGEHDITIRVLTTSEDSTNSILSYELEDDYIVADSGKFILLPTTGHFGRYSSDGEVWTSFDLPDNGFWRCLAAGDNKFVAIASGGDQGAYSTNGVDWSAITLPVSTTWSSVVYGDPSTSTNGGVFVAVASNVNAGAYSTNGITWTNSTLPSAGDSTFNEWVDIAFGNDVFVAIANSGNIAAVGTWNGTALSWQTTIMDVIADSTPKDWVSIAYGNRRFVAMSSTGEVAYSFNGLDWYAATMPTQDGSTIHNWKQIRYGQGVFFAVGDTGGRTVAADPTSGPTNFAASSYDGIVWTSRSLPAEDNWAVVAFGNPDVTLGDSTYSNSQPTFVVAPGTLSDNVVRIHTGARTMGRVIVKGGGIDQVKLWEPGSGYIITPTLTVIDPLNSEEPEFRIRMADGVLAQPTFINKGSAYKTSTTIVTISGDGFADITPRDRFITVDGLTVMPGPGAQFYIGGRSTFFIATVVGINETTLPDGTIRSTFRVSPTPDLSDNLEHNMEVVIREKYSQVRITGHDFLDVGTGNFEETNYPELYVNYGFDTAPLNEVQSINGGRVFYTSTDQDGNFRAGKQFAVEQATGIITISADFFDLQGLTELRLAGVQVGSTAIIREFSKDKFFLQDSNNIVPTQRAVRAYLQNRLNIGGEDLLTPSFIAGTVRVGPNLVNSTAGLTIEVPVVADFRGPQAGVAGSILAQTMFFRSFGTK